MPQPHPHQPIRVTSEAWRQLGAIPEADYQFLRPILWDVAARSTPPTTPSQAMDNVIVSFVLARNAAIAQDLHNRQELR